MRVCEYGELDGSNCKKGVGGVLRTGGIKSSGITDITFNAEGKVTSITLAGSESIKSVSWADNSTATFTESEQTRDNDSHLGEFIGNLYGVTNAFTQWADNVSACCEGIVLFHEMADGSIRVQGIEYLGATAPIWRYSIKKTLLFTGTNHGTTDTKPMMTIKAESVTEYHAPFVDSALTYDDLLAL